MDEQQRDDELEIQRVVPDRLILRFPRLHPATILKFRAQLNLRNYPSEKWLEKKLLRFGLKNFVRNWSIAGRFFGDFVFRREKVILEIDGSHHNDPVQKKTDEDRDEFLTCLGWTVYRIPWSSRIADFELQPKLEALFKRQAIIDSLIRIPKHMFESYCEARDARREEMATVKIPDMPERIFIAPGVALPKNGKNQPKKVKPPKPHYPADPKDRKPRFKQFKRMHALGINIPKNVARRQAAELIQEAIKNGIFPNQVTRSLQHDSPDNPTPSQGKLFKG